ncbi:protein ATAF2-like [Olea europaea var. sylvestris]|uniref:protein ATAF2-like n=1 Tax=Olea europaea var. sylvestris TaxID=158386 RepID=UPI000C1D5D78|nr:protein ATAF2-like [Olea europaea var. sylvestris]
MDNQLSDDEYFRSLPAGFRFKPTHDELIVHYLMKKIENEELPRNKINVVNLYEFNPEILADEYRSSGENEWFFFTPRSKKYKNGKRPNRTAGDGYWKASGADIEVKHNGVDVGSRKTLVYYEGKPPVKTSWIMHEYTVNNPPPVQKSSADDMKLDDWVLCRIRKNENRKRKRDDEIQEPDHNNTDEVASHQENTRRAGEDSMHVAPEDNLPYCKSEIALADPFINDNYQNLPNADVHNTLSILQHQNVVTYSNPVPIPIVPPNHSIGGYVYSQYPVGYMADVKEGLYPAELPGIPEMDINEFFDSVPGGYQEIPALDNTNFPDFMYL